MRPLAIVSADGSVAPAPERLVAPSLWGLTPADLAAEARRLDLSHRGSFGRLFNLVQRVDRWTRADDADEAKEGALRPHPGRDGRGLLAALDTSLPAIVDRVHSSDGATRLVLETVDGHRIEAVHMPRDHVREPRTTFCVSSQVGCAMGCTFCATGTMGIIRNLTAGEIVGQVLALMAALGPAQGDHLNIVFMGMGEPLHNLAHVAKAVEVLCHPDGLAMSPRRITVSTSGLVTRIDQFAKLAVRPRLSVSINATTDETRSAIMPVNRTWKLADLKACLERYPFEKGEKALLAYVLLRGENDTDDDAHRLADFAAGIPAIVNLIPLNEHEGTTHKAPDGAWVQQFSKRLYDALKARPFTGVLTIRNNRGRDVQGACGQLVTASMGTPLPRSRALS